ncbi:hypothetical protein KPH14_002069 [Odynerus spinipes]|uniref:Uncharacterized protein n=1 Tax=Odynerus spinipes TaxID=1348599 RepID=A0AAD9VLM0_9HYME|nr:hypothetical protein KPH14_002069 [Odynerus spinipes]
MAKKQNYTEYRPRVAEGLLQTVPLQNYNRQEPLSNGDIPMRLQAQQWGHFPKHICRSHAIEKKSNKSLQTAGLSVIARSLMDLTAGTNIRGGFGSMVFTLTV